MFVFVAGRSIGVSMGDGQIALSWPGVIYKHQFKSRYSYIVFTLYIVGYFIENVSRNLHCHSSYQNDFITVLQNLLYPFSLSPSRPLRLPPRPLDLIPSCIEGRSNYFPRQLSIFSPLYKILGETHFLIRKDGGGAGGGL